VLHRSILVDIYRCIGCEACVEACQAANGQKSHAATCLDTQTFTFLMRRGEERFVRRLCMHCEQPTCVSVCPVQALRKTNEGAVTYDPQKCMGCRYCLLACPFNVPTFEWNAVVPRVRKCELCFQRSAGPACAEACPETATITGERNALIKEARQRLAQDPKSYYPGIYGLHELGGTGVLYIGPPKLASWGLPLFGSTRPLGDLTWNILHHVPDVALFGGVLLGGLWWLTKRKQEVAAANGSSVAQDQRRAAEPAPPPKKDPDHG
jgi:formate dehydrogenase iron-sulfur subunit